VSFDPEKALRDLKRRGVASNTENGVSVKIVPMGHHDEGFGVETTVAGDRRYPTEDPMPLQEAQRLALAQLLEPRASYKYVPTPEASKPTPRADSLPYITLSDLMDRYRRRGMDAHAAWNEYIKNTILLKSIRTEVVDAKDFMSNFRKACERR